MATDGELRNACREIDVAKGGRHGQAMKTDKLYERTPLTREAQAWQDLAEQAQTAWADGAVDHAGALFFQLQECSTPWMLAIARWKGPPEQAEDLVAQAHLDLYEMMVGGKPIVSVKGLLGTILRRRIVDLYRRRGKVSFQQLDESQLSEHVDLQATVDEVEDQETARYVANTILDLLPPLEQRVIVARHVMELSVEETSARLGITPDQVKKRCKSGLERAQQIAKERGLRDDVV